MFVVVIQHPRILLASKLGSIETFCRTFTHRGVQFRIDFAVEYKAESHIKRAHLTMKAVHELEAHFTFVSGNETTISLRAANEHRRDHSIMNMRTGCFLALHRYGVRLDDSASALLQVAICKKIVVLHIREVVEIYVGW